LNILHHAGHRSSDGFVVAPSPSFFIPWFLFHSRNRLSHSLLEKARQGGMWAEEQPREAFHDGKATKQILVQNFKQTTSG